MTLILFGYFKKIKVIIYQYTSLENQVGYVSNYEN